MAELKEKSSNKDRMDKKYYIKHSNGKESFIKVSPFYNGNHKVYKQGMFSNISNAEIYDQVISQHSIVEIGERIKNLVLRKDSVSLDNSHVVPFLTEMGLNACVINDTGEIIFDHIFYLALQGYMVLVFIWETKLNKTSGDINKERQINETFFEYILSFFYSIIKENDVPEIYSFDEIYKQYLIMDKDSTINVAIICFYSALYFCLGHEYAHAYFYSKKLEMENDEEEFAADRMAYDLLLQCIKDEESSNIATEDRELFEYAYKAPLMTFTFLYVYYHVLETLEDSSFSVDNKIVQDIESRDGYLSKYIEETGFHNNEGELLYDSFDNLSGLFLELLHHKKQTGELKTIVQRIKKGRK